MKHAVKTKRTASTQDTARSQERSGKNRPARKKRSPRAAILTVIALLLIVAAIAAAAWFGAPILLSQSQPPASAFHERMAPMTANDREPSAKDLEEMAEAEQQKQEAERAAQREAIIASLPTAPVETVVEEDVLAAINPDDYFTIAPISDDLFARIQGTTFSANCPVSRDNLRYLRLLHVNAEGETKIGEMITNASIAEDVRDVFRQLYHASYPIERIRLQDDYGGGDEASMEANNTSCFNCRPVEGTNQMSLHGYGVAIDINPLYNPYVWHSGGQVLPVTANAYADRSVQTAYTINPGDLCHRLFTERGYTWGGIWSDPDYQHFEKS